MIRIFQALAAMAALMFTAVAAHAAPPPLSAYGSLPAIEDLDISASGKLLAFVGVVGENRRLVMQDLSGGVIGVIDVGDSKVRGIMWAGDEHLIVLTSQTTSIPEYGIRKSEWLIAQSYSLAKKRFINIAARSPMSWNFISYAPDVREVDGTWYAYFANYSRSRPILVLRRARLDDGLTETIETMPANDAEGWLIDREGTPQARVRYDTSRGYWSLGARKGAIWPDIYQVEAPLDPPLLMGFGRDGRSLLVQESAEAGSEFVEVDPETGESRPALPDDRFYRSMIFDPASKRLIGATYFDVASRYAFFDPADAAAWDAVLAAFKGQHVSLYTWSADRKKVVVHVDGPKNSGVFYLIDLQAKRADIIGETYPGVPPDQVAEMRPYTYKAADGMEIPGFLTLPPGREAKNLPLVVMPHGGPQVHDSQAFDYWAQAIASRGYAVLQPNYRGSSGYGWDYVEAGHGEWGRKMQTDLSDGVRALAAEGVIDPKRVCIVGASYGGYAAMAGVTVQQGVYRCAVAVAGVSDLRLMLKLEARDMGRNSEGMRYWRRFMGAEKDSDPALDAISPTHFAARADAPILLIHGKDDTVVPYRQSAEFAEALRSAGKPVEMVTLEGEDHGMSRRATREQMLEASVSFLLRQNPPD